MAIISVQVQRSREKDYLEKQAKKHQSMIDKMTNSKEDKIEYEIAQIEQRMKNIQYDLDGAFIGNKVMIGKIEIYKILKAQAVKRLQQLREVPNES